MKDECKNENCRFKKFYEKYKDKIGELETKLEYWKYEASQYMGIVQNKIKHIIKKDDE